MKKCSNSKLVINERYFRPNILNINNNNIIAISKKKINTIVILTSGPLQNFPQLVNHSRIGSLINLMEKAIAKRATKINIIIRVSNDQDCFVA